MSSAKWQVKGVKFEMLLKNTPLTREFASWRPTETLKLRVSAQMFKAFSHIDRKAVVLGFDDVVEKVVSLKNARLMGDAVVAPKQEGAQGFYRRAASGRPLPGRGCAAVGLSLTADIRRRGSPTLVLGSDCASVSAARLRWSVV